MEGIKIFENSEFGAVRVVDVNGEPWFVARDVASALGYVDTTQAIRMHCEKAKDFRGVEMTATATPMKIIPEEDVYALIFGSHLESATKFRRWICDEVLPSIRKHGGYLTPAKLEEALTDPDTLIRLATNLKAEREKRQALEAQAAADRPKVVFAESIEVAKTSILVGEMAKLIKQATGYEMG